MRRSLLLLALMTLPGPIRGADASKPVSFRDDVAPILVKHCLGCHNDQKADSGLNMATFALLKQGGQMGEDLILEPGDPDASYLIELVRPGGAPRMPYQQPPLSDEAIATLERWVAEGATFDGESEEETRITSLVDPLTLLPQVAVQVPTADPVTDVAFSADGTVLAAAQGTRVVLFDPTHGDPLGVLEGHPGPVTAVRISPDGTTLVAAGGRAGLFGAVTVWDLETQQKRHDLRGHADGILAADLASDGTTLATASYDRTILLWDIGRGGEPLRELVEHTDAVYAVAFAPEGDVLASASSDRTAKVWDVASGRRLVTLSDATAELYAVAFGPDGRTVLAAGADKTIRAWDLSENRDSVSSTRSVSAHSAPVVRLALSDDGETLYSSGEDQVVKLWDRATLRPQTALTDQPDWPLALAASPDGALLAVGRYDGSLALLDLDSGETRVALLDAPQPEPEPEPAKVEDLIREASLNPPSPRGATRGSTVRVTLSGNAVGQASEVVFTDPALSASIVPPEPTEQEGEAPDPNRLQIDLTIAPDARVGVHRFGVQTPLGVPAFQTFAVTEHPEAPETEPNDDPSRVEPITLPATLVGTLNQPGDVDHFRFEVRQGQTLVFETLGKGLRSSLNAILTLLDDQGRTLVEAVADEGGGEPVLIHPVDRDGVLTLRVADLEFGGSGNHFYRIHAGTDPYIASVFPLGVERGQTTEVAVSGANLDGVSVVPVTTEAEPGAIIDVPVALPDGSRPRRTARVVVAEGPQTVESSEPNDEPGQAPPIAAPGGVSGRIDRPGDVDHYRFEARQGETVILEVFGHRLGQRIDPVVEVLDADGQPIPRAVVRPVAETAVAFRDHGSQQRSMRLTQWTELAQNDYVLVGREVLRIFALPRNPDDDCLFWASQGQRIGFLETTPEQHPEGQAIYKVEIHPPGTTFPPGGVAPVTLYYRNDDGGPGFGKDARVTFDPPADGVYIARVSDARGLGGEDFGYHLVLRRPRPGFQLALSSENPNVPRGGATALTASILRRDGFDEPVEVTLEDLPPGLTATSAVIEREAYEATLVLMADDDAPAVSPPTWRASARVVTDDEVPERSEAAAALTQTLRPGGDRTGWITVTDPVELDVWAESEQVTIRPGERVPVTFAIDRRIDLASRVPIDVRNLPHGVRVLDIGLNGVLITEQERRRTVVLYAEPWVEPTERPFYGVARMEVLGPPQPGTAAPVIGSSREQSSRPISLVVLPAAPALQAQAPATSAATATGSP